MPCSGPVIADRTASGVEQPLRKRATQEKLEINSCIRFVTGISQELVDQSKGMGTTASFDQFFRKRRHVSSVLWGLTVRVRRGARSALSGDIVGSCVLFTVGKSLISWYIGTSAVASSFGAAGALIVLLLWVYYSAQIFLLGAEFTKTYAKTHGSKQAGGLSGKLGQLTPSS